MASASILALSVICPVSPYPLMRSVKGGETSQMIFGEYPNPPEECASLCILFVSDRVLSECDSIIYRRSTMDLTRIINMLNSVYQGDMFDILQDWQKLRRDVLAAVQELKKICYLQQLQKPE